MSKPQAWIVFKQIEGGNFIRVSVMEREFDSAEDALAYAQVRHLYLSLLAVSPMLPATGKARRNPKDSPEGQPEN
jgi:hypothetical protein